MTKRYRFVSTMEQRDFLAFAPKKIKATANGAYDVTVKGEEIDIEDYRISHIKNAIYTASIKEV